MAGRAGIRGRHRGLQPAAGPAFTELAIFCAWRVRGRLGALAGGLAFIVPGLVCILALSALFLEGTPPLWVREPGPGRAPPWPRSRSRPAGPCSGPAGRARRAGPGRRFRWAAYLLAGGAAAATIGPWLVLVLLGCGVAELAVGARAGSGRTPAATDASCGAAARALRRCGPAGLRRDGRRAARRAGRGGLGGVQGGGAVVRRRLRDHPADAGGRGGAGWMTSGQFLNAVALGQITPGPVVQTVSAVGYAAAGLGGGLLAALVAFSPSFVFVLGGARCFECPAHQQERPVVPGRRGPGGDRGDPRLGHPAGRGAEPAVAVRGAGRRGGPAARAEARGRGHPARRGRDRAGYRAGRGAAAALSGLALTG